MSSLEKVLFPSGKIKLQSKIDRTQRFLIESKNRKIPTFKDFKPEKEKYTKKKKKHFTKISKSSIRQISHFRL